MSNTWQSEREVIGAALGGARRTVEDRSAEAAERLVRRADDAGLVDVAYARADSPLGPLAIAATDRGLVRLAFLAGTSEADVAEGLAKRVSPRVLELPARLDGARRELDQYFAGDRRRFDVAVDWRVVRGFRCDVLRATAGIDYGATASYTEVATRAGSPRAYRAAGNALHHNPIAIVVPCHRVLHSTGGLGGYAGGLDAKRFLLDLERGA